MEYLKNALTKVITKEMDDKIMLIFNNEQQDNIDCIKSQFRKWFELNSEQQETVKRIAAEFPYRIELVSGIFIEQKYSEEKTRDILMKRLVRGCDIYDA